MNKFISHDYMKNATIPANFSFIFSWENEQPCSFVCLLLINILIRKFVLQMEMKLEEIENPFFLLSFCINLSNDIFQSENDLKGQFFFLLEFFCVWHEHENCVNFLDRLSQFLLTSFIDASKIFLEKKYIFENFCNEN